MEQKKHTASLFGGNEFPMCLGELVAALSSMGAAERLDAIQQRVKRLADDVVGDELAGDDPLLEFGVPTCRVVSRSLATCTLLRSGMDSLSGVEFRNRLQQEYPPQLFDGKNSVAFQSFSKALRFGGIRLPNSAVFDYPTAPWQI